MLKAMDKVKSNHQNIIVAGRITHENLPYIREKTGCLIFMVGKLFSLRIMF